MEHIVSPIIGILFLLASVDDKFALVSKDIDYNNTELMTNVSNNKFPQGDLPILVIGEIIFDDSVK